MDIGERIRSIRRERNWTQDDLAKKAGLLCQNVARYETGRTTPRKAMLARFAKAFDLTVEELVAEPKRTDEFPADPELAKLFRHISTLSEDDRAAVKRVLNLVVKQSLVQQVIAS